MEKVARVIDGDTFVTKSGRRVCLDGVDAPDVWSPGAEDAAKKLRSLLRPGRTVSLRVTEMGLGRYVAEVWAGEKPVNKEMAKYIKKNTARWKKEFDQ